MLDVRLSAVKLLKDGAVAKDVYNEAASMLQDRGLGDAFVKNIGFAVSLLGIELQLTRRLVLSTAIAPSSLVPRMSAS